MGPAVCDPDSPSATKTATARSPCAAIIQAWVGSDPPAFAVPYSAVPVLAITPGGCTDCRRAPDPSVTTACIIARNASASPAVSGWAGDAVALALGLGLGLELELA